MVHGVTAGVGVVEDPVGARSRAAWRRPGTSKRGNVQSESINVFVRARLRSDVRSYVQINRPVEMVSGHEQIPSAYRESLADFAVNLEAGLLAIGIALVSVDYRPALRPQRVRGK